MNEPSCERHNKITACAVAALCVLLAAGLIVMPKHNWSDNENRQLASMPEFSAQTLAEGEYLAGVEDYLTDHFPLRDFFVSVNTRFNTLIGRREINGVFICDDGFLIDKYSAPARTDAILSALNRLPQALGEYKVTLMLAPTAAAIYSEKLPLFAQQADQLETMRQYYEGFDGRTVDVVQTLLEHKDEHQLYYRTDHHWTTYGSYLAYVEYCKALGLTPVEYSAKTVSETFNGTLYSKSGVRFMESDVIESFNIDHDTSLDIMELPTNPVKNDSIYFDERLETKDKYTYFLGDNKPVITARAENGIDRKLLVFKDSYSHCMAPMLLEHYGEITFIDIRYVKQSLDKYIDISEYDDALFLYSVDGFANQNNLGILKYFIKPTQE